MPTEIEWTNTTSVDARIFTLKTGSRTVHGRAVLANDGWRVRVGGVERGGPFSRASAMHAWVIDHVEELLGEAPDGKG